MKSSKKFIDTNELDIYNETLMSIPEKELELMKEAYDILYSKPSKKYKGLKTKPVRNSETDPKIGRNESCPCGSGKKYKNCCL